MGSFLFIVMCGGCLFADTNRVRAAAGSAEGPEPRLAERNRPADHTTIFDLNFDSKSFGWSYSSKWGDPKYLQEVSDADAPKSGDRVLEFIFPIGFRDIASPARAGKDFPGRRELYVAYWVKISKPWQYHTSAVNKLFFIGTNANPKVGNEVVVSLRGTTEAQAQIMVAVQHPGNTGAGTHGGYYLPNMGRPGFRLGQWHLIELHGVQSTTGLPNGSLTWWVDGVLTGRHTNVRFHPQGDAVFDSFTLDPNWGGQGSPAKGQRDWIRVDHLLVTGK